jgi:hypothetical protein
MKKLVLISTVIASLAGMSAFGQGYVLFQTGKSTGYDGFTTPGVSGLAATVDGALMWAPSGTVQTPLVNTMSSLASTPTTGNSTTTESYTVAAAWTAILSDPNFTLAYNFNGGSPTTGNAIMTSSSTGVFGSALNSFNMSNVSGSQVAVIGTTYSMFLITWNAAFATPAAAQTAGSAVGWGPVFQYTAYALTSSANSMLALVGRSGTFIPAPEPTTLALAGLGSLSLLLFRRRK